MNRTLYGEDETLGKKLARLGRSERTLGRRRQLVARQVFPVAMTALLACSSPSGDNQGGIGGASGSGATSGSTGTAISGAPATSAGSSSSAGDAASPGGQNAVAGASATGGTKASSTGGSGGENEVPGGAANTEQGGATGGTGVGGQAGSPGAAGTSENAAGTGGGSLSAGCGVSSSLKSGRSTLSVSGTTREYVLRLPDDYDSNRAHKLIFGFHARGGNAGQVTGGSNNDYYGLYSLAKGSAIFVAPEGLDAGWRNTDGRDIAFVKAMLAEFKDKLCIDDGRIFSVGFSFGGMMSDAIGCAMADVFRAIAPMAGAIPNPEHPYSGCDETNMHPIAVWMAHGNNDTVVPLSDGKDALNLFIARNKCQAQTSPVDPSPCVAYQGCTEGYPIHYCEFSGGHGVPNFAAKAIWAFFDQF